MVNFFIKPTKKRSAAHRGETREPTPQQNRYLFKRHDKQHHVNIGVLLKFSSNLSPAGQHMPTLPDTERLLDSHLCLAATWGEVWWREPDVGLGGGCPVRWQREPETRGQQDSEEQKGAEEKLK